MELLESFAKIKNPVSVTIGVFDGVHLGHQFLLKTLQEEGHKTLVITFKNHPKAYLKKGLTRNIYPFHQRVALLEKQGIDYLLALNFSAAIQPLTAAKFLKMCQTFFPMQTLLLGHDTSLGSDRLNNLAKIQKLFPHTLQVPPYQIEGITVSSEKIRNALSQGDFQNASKWLGRPYELILDSSLNTTDLALPPNGTWSVLINGKRGEVEINRRSLKILNQDLGPKKPALVPFFVIQWDLSHLS